MDSQSTIVRSPDQLSILLSSTGDVPTAHDTLGFIPYVESVARFLESPSTQPPLAIAIEGEWGSGKSSFMKMLRNRLRGNSRSSIFRESLTLERAGGTGLVKALWVASRAAFKSAHSVTVEFNAWRNDKEEALWAAFALKCTRELRRGQAWYRKPFGWLKLLFSRVNGTAGAIELFRFIGLLLLWTALLLAVPIAVLLNGKGWTQQKAHDFSQWASKGERPPNAGAPAPARSEPQTGVSERIIRWGLNGGILGTWLAFVVFGSTQILKLGNPLEAKLDKVLRTPSYEGRLAFIDQFHEDFRKILDAYAGKRRIYIFIDDLDRCEVPKAGELMQAINLLIDDDPRVVFVIGMDREKVAAAVAAKYATLLSFLTNEVAGSPADKLAFGYAYLEKFIQIQYRLPQPRPSSLRTFLEDLAISRTTQSELSWLRSLFPRRTVESEPLSGPPPESAGPSVKADEKVQAINRRAVELLVRHDSEIVRDVTLMVAPVFDLNPRRLKQFINLFRLSALIASELGLFDAVDNKPVMTFEQLGKFEAISMKWPDIVRDLESDKLLLSKLTRQAIGKNVDEIDQRLSRSPRLKYLLSFGILDKDGKESIDGERYSLESLDVDALLSIMAPVVRPTVTTPYPDASSATESETQSATLYLRPTASVAAEEPAFQEPEETPDSLRDSVAIEVERLGRRYAQIRNTMPAGDERTSEMTAIVRRARDLAGRMKDNELPLNLFRNSEHPGSRIVALGLAQGARRAEYLPIALDGILRSRSAFEQYHAMSLANTLIDALDNSQKNELGMALQQKDTLQAIGDDSSRLTLLTQILTRLQGKPTISRASRRK